MPTIDSFFNAYNALRTYASDRANGVAKKPIPEQALENYEFVCDQGTKSISLVKQLENATPEEMAARRAQTKEARFLLMNALCDVSARLPDSVVVKMSEDQGRGVPLTMREFRRVFDTVSMVKNVEEAIATRSMKMTPAEVLGLKLAGLNDHSQGVEDLKKTIGNLAAQCDTAYDELKCVKGSALVKDLQAAEKEGIGKDYKRYEAYADALVNLTEALSALRDQVGGDEDKELIGGLVDDVMASSGALHRATAMLAEAAACGKEDFTKMTVDQFLRSMSVTKNVQGAQTASEIAQGLGALLAAVAEVDNGLVSGNQVGPLVDLVAEAKANLNVQLANPGRDVNPMALRQFLWQLEGAEDRLTKLCAHIAEVDAAHSNDPEWKDANLDTVKQTLKCAEMVRQVLNGEQDVVFLVQMLKIGATYAMVNPLFAEKNKKGDFECIDDRASGATILSGHWTDPKSGRDVQTYLKEFRCDKEPDRVTTLTVVNGDSTNGDMTPMRRMKYQVATATLARHIGVGQNCVQAGVTICDGNPYLVTEKATGVDGNRVGFFEEGEDDDGKFSCGIEINGEDFTKGMAEDQRQRVVAQLLTQANRLEWLDFLTGEQDRHMGNLMVDVEGSESQNGVNQELLVSVRGFDNAECFGKNRIGLRKFCFSDKKQIEWLNEMLNGRIDEWLKDLSETSPAYRDRKGQLVLDADLMSPEDFGLFRKVTGFNSMSVPTFITREVYNELMTSPLNKWFEIKAELSPLLTQDELTSLRNRFLEARRVAEELGKRGMVFGEHDILTNPEAFKKVRDSVHDEGERVLREMEAGKRHAKSEESRQSIQRAKNCKLPYAYQLMFRNGGLKKRAE